MAPCLLPSIETYNTLALEKLRPVALHLDIKLVEDPVHNLEELKSALQKRAALKDIGIDAILFMPDIVTHSPDGFEAIAKFAKEYNIPISSTIEFMIDLGAVFSFAPVPFETGNLAATLADKIFRGIPAETIPVVTPEAHLTINYKLAQELGISISDDMLVIADKVIR